MGLPVRIVLHANNVARGRDAAREAFARIASLDRSMSDYRTDSEVHRIHDHAGSWVEVSTDLYAVLERSLEIARASDGAFDPTVGPLVALWRQARTSRVKPAESALDRARTLVGWQHVAMDPARRAVRLVRSGMRLDLGGIAKGYILQEAVRTLERRGVTRVLVEAGGDIVVGDAPPGRGGWSIEVSTDADPAFRDRAGGLTNAALATSGPTVQFVEIEGVRYSHVVDPRTGLGLTNGVLARVIAPDGAVADALATALSVTERERAGRLLARYPDAIASLELGR
jgi:thiamine biosynthesis lipoprotein